MNTRKPYMQTEWYPQSDMFPCLSISQPFATAIAQGKKTIELRKWGTRMRGLIAIHASLSWYGGVKFDGKTKNDSYAIDAIKSAAIRMGTPANVSEYPTGAIIAIAHLVSCKKLTKEEYEDLEQEHMSNAQYDAKEYAWMFERVEQLQTPIKVRGYLGLFPVDAIAIERARIQ